MFLEEAGADSPPPLEPLDRPPRAPNQVGHAGRAIMDALFEAGRPLSLDELVEVWPTHAGPSVVNHARRLYLRRRYGARRHYWLSRGREPMDSGAPKMPGAPESVNYIVRRRLHGTPPRNMIGRGNVIEENGLYRPGPNPPLVNNPQTGKPEPYTAERRDRELKQMSAYIATTEISRAWQRYEERFGPFDATDRLVLARGLAEACAPRNDRPRRSMGTMLGKHVTPLVRRMNPEEQAATIAAILRGEQL